MTPATWTAVLLSLKVAFWVTVVILIPAVFLGWLLARVHFRGKLLVEALIHAPMVVPPVVTGYVLLLVFGRRGWVGGWLYEQWGVQLAFHWQGAVLAAALVALPLAVRSIRLAISMVDARLEEAGATLGYGPIKCFVMITLPLAWPGILAGVVLAFSRSLGEFGATVTFAGNVQGQTQTLPLAIYSALQMPGEESVAMQLALVSVGLCVITLVVSELLAKGRFRNARRGNGILVAKARVYES